MKRVTLETVKIMNELMRSGTLLDPIAVREARVTCRELKIVRNGDNFENELALQAGSSVASPFNLCTRFSLCTRLVIENVSKRPVRLRQEPVSLDFEWIKDDFQLSKLDEERGFYLLELCGRQFHRDLVLNHHLRAGRNLRPGQRFDGLLLGEGYTFTSLGYADREEVPLTIKVHTENETYSLRTALSVSRLKPESQPVLEPKPRRSLLESKDPVPVG